MNSGDDVFEFFDIDENGQRVPAIAPEGNPGGAAYFDGDSYNYDAPFSVLEAPIGSVYLSRRPQLLRTGWVGEE